MEYMTDYLINNDIKISRWNTESIIYTIPVEVVLTAILGEQLTESDYNKIFELSSVNIPKNTVYSIKLNEKNNKISLQKLDKIHQKGRDQIEILGNGKIIYIPGEKFNKQNGKR